MTGCIMEVKITKRVRVANNRCEIAAQKGFEFFGNFKEGLGFSEEDVIEKRRYCDYGVYKRLSCGHTEVKLHKVIAEKKTDYCLTCVDNEYKILVENLDMEFICFSRLRSGGTKYVDVKLSCGHFKSIQTGNLKIGKYTCEHCRKQRLIESCEANNFKYIQHDTNANHFVKLPCGCTKSLFLTSIKAGAWSCSEHNLSNFDYEGSIYLFLLRYKDYSWLKLGYSRNPTDRLRGFSEEGLKGTLIDQVIFSTGYEALRLEKSLHKKFKTNKYTNPLLKQAMKSGTTECYPVEMLNVLQLELEQIKEKCQTLSSLQPVKHSNLFC